MVVLKKTKSYREKSILIVVNAEAISSAASSNEGRVMGEYGVKI